MKKLGFIGWRGMVGSVLCDRMREEGDFKNTQNYFFSTSQAGEKAPEEAHEKTLLDAHSLEHLKEMDIILTCQGGDYSKEIQPKLRASGWQGYWIDAASALRMQDSAVIVLDPLNKDIIERKLNEGVKDFIGGNCTVSLLLMATGGLFAEGLVEWISSMTYQAASGGGARHMKELLSQMKVLGSKNLAADILDLDREVAQTLRGHELDTEMFGVPLAGSLIPWIDSPMDNGQTREEWKAAAEANKILGLENNPVAIDGTCVRVGSMRCHAQACTVKLKKTADLSTIEKLITCHNDWVEFVPNEMQASKERLTPAYMSGTMKIPVGRVRKLMMGEDYLNLFTVGDQLLWGAAEPLRRMLGFIK